MRPKREMLDFQLMMVFYLNGHLVARHGWETPVSINDNYIFTEDDQLANDWMVVEKEE